MTDLPGKPVSNLQLAAARMLMSAGGSMQEAAIALKVRSQDLDRALWRHIGTPLAEMLTPPRKKRYRADF